MPASAAIRMETYWWGLRSGLAGPSIRNTKRRSLVSMSKTTAPETPPVTDLTLMTAAEPRTALIAERAVSRCAVGSAANASLLIILSKAEAD